MNNLRKLQVLLLFVICTIMSWQSASAQTYIRYVKPEDLGTKTLYADSVLTSITLPRGIGRLSNYPKINAAAYELGRVLQDPDKKLMQVWVCGSTSPDGLWGDNVELSKMRTNAAAEYIKEVTGISDSMIHRESLNEDWDRLAELVAESDIPYKSEVLYIIRTKTWGERKTALQRLDGGNVWQILEKDFFPQLRCVRFAIFCKWDPSKPYLSVPVEKPAPSPAPVSTKDTVYVRDTVYMLHQQVVVHQEQKKVAPEEVYQQYRQESLNQKREKRYWDTPWMMGVKTNLLSDAMVIPMAGLELQIGRRVSLDLQGWYTNFNVFCTSDKNTNVYGFSPELRWWTKNRAMERGSFFGIHGMVSWYTMQWTDGFLYQNGKENQYSVNAGNNTPAWSVGLTYGYSFALDRKAHWGLELVLGLGYGHFSQNRGLWNETEKVWSIYDHQNEAYIGITKAGINLTYRFSMRRVKPEYYK